MSYKTIPEVVSAVRDAYDRYVNARTAAERDAAAYHALVVLLPAIDLATCCDDPFASMVILELLRELIHNDEHRRHGTLLKVDSLLTMVLVTSYRICTLYADVLPPRGMRVDRDVVAERSRAKHRSRLGAAQLEVEAAEEAVTIAEGALNGARARLKALETSLPTNGPDGASGV